MMAENEKTEEQEEKKVSVSERLKQTMSQIPEKAKKLKDDVAFRMWDTSDKTQDVVNETAEKTKKTVEDTINKTTLSVMNKQNEVMEDLAKKQHMVKKNIEAKNRIRDFASGEIDREEMAYLMASDPELQQSIGNVSHSMLHPSPIKGLKTERTNLQLDVGYGFSVFMEELRQPLDNEVEAIMDIDNMSMLVEMGQDKTIPPTVRENYLSEAGISEESMEEFVTRDDYRDYVTQLEQKFRQEHMVRLGLVDKDTLDVEDENRLNELVEDSMSIHDDEEEAFVYTSGPEGEMENTYKETYQMSSEEMFRMFDNADNYDHLEYEDMDFPAYVDYDFEDTEFMRHSVEEFHNLQDMSIADSETYLQSIEADMQTYEAELRAMDEQNAYPELTDADLASLNEQAPPELSDDDLMSLDEQAPPELSDDDLQSLYDTNQHQQK